MAKAEYGKIWIGGTGPAAPVLDDDTLVVNKVVLFLANSSSVVSAGYGDGTSKFTGGSAYGDENTTKLITHYRNISGVKTKVFEADLTALATGEFYINVTTCTAACWLHFLAFEE